MSPTGKNIIQRTHYEVLATKEDASYEKIRASYKTAVLNSHPDKLNNKSDGSIDQLRLQQDFLDVQRAWEILSNSKSRAEYNKELQILRHESELPANEIELEDMSMETVDDFQHLFYECRCGDYFSITSSELGEMGIFLDKESVEVQYSTDPLPASVLIPCASCSLKVRLLITPIR